MTWSDGDVFQINLGGNQLNGSIPPELGNLTNLGTLVLGVNQLSGSISPELGNLVDLQELRLSFNQLSDPLPASLINLDELQQFYFNNTNLCEPQNTAFQSWLADIPDVQGTGVACMTSAGGTVTSPDEIALVFFPPETNSEEIFIYLTITLIEDTSVIPATGGFQLLGDVYDFSAVDAEGNPITNFDEMLSITLSYDPADLGGLDEESLTINFYDELLASWVPILSVVDLVNDTGLQQKLTISHCDEAQRVGGVHQGNYG